MQVRSGDVVAARPDPTEGSEQRDGSRPCLVVQSDTGNEHSSTTIVAPFTTQYGDRTDPFEVDVTADGGPPNEDSVVNGSKLRVVDVEAGRTPNHGSIPAHELPAVDRALEYSLGLR